MTKAICSNKPNPTTGKVLRRRERYQAWARGEAPGTKIHWIVMGKSPEGKLRRLGRCIRATKDDAKAYALQTFRWHLERKWRLLVVERDAPDAYRRIKEFAASERPIPPVPDRQPVPMSRRGPMPLPVDREYKPWRP